MNAQNRIRRTALLSCLCAAVLALVSVSAALAHPLGNFTVNRYAGLLIQRDGIDVEYIVDMAEIPAYQEISQQIGQTKNGAPDKTKTDAYRGQKCAEFLPNLTLALNNDSLILDLQSSDLEFPPGAGGLLTLRLTCNYRAALTGRAASNAVIFRDANFLDRIGWREIVVRSDGTTIRESSAPSASVSDRLKSYPTDLLSNPPNQIEARFKFILTAASSSSTVATQVQENVLDRTQDQFASLITMSDTNLPLVLLALALAIGLGALHAVSPGHGKTIMAAYLVGARGTFMQAMVLGMTVTITHTLGVLILGLITLYASRYILPESLYPWLSLTSGMIVIAMGITLVVDRSRARSHAQQPDHDEPHEHHHGFLGHEHVYLPAATSRGLSWRSLVGLGLAGGLVPSTSALILLLSAISLHRIPFGIVLIIAFGLGMAIVLVGVGVLLVRASNFLERRHVPARVMDWLPLASAIVVIGAGLVVTAQALMQVGFIK